MPPSERGPSPLSKQLSFELTTNVLAEQERALSGLRTRAGTVLAAASIAGSFLGAKTGHGSLDTWGILALISFVLCFGSAIWVLVPHEFVLPSAARPCLPRATITECAT